MGCIRAPSRLAARPRVGGSTKADNSVVAPQAPKNSQRRCRVVLLGALTRPLSRQRPIPIFLCRQGHSLALDSLTRAHFGTMVLPSVGASIRTASLEMVRG